MGFCLASSAILVKATNQARAEPHLCRNSSVLSAPTISEFLRKCLWHQDARCSTEGLAAYMTDHFVTGRRHSKSDPFFRIMKLYRANCLSKPKTNLIRAEKV